MKIWIFNIRSCESVVQSSSIPHVLIHPEKLHCVLTSLLQQASCCHRPKKCYSLVAFTSSSLWFINPSLPPSYAPIQEWGICDLLFHVLMRPECGGRCGYFFGLSGEWTEIYYGDRLFALSLVACDVLQLKSVMVAHLTYRCDTYFSCKFWSLLATYWWPIAVWITT